MTSVGSCTGFLLPAGRDHDHSNLLLLHQRVKPSHTLARRRIKFSLRALAVVEVAEPRAGGREDHKIFDEAVITVRSGAGGSGEVVAKGKGKTVPNFKYRAGGREPKQIWLPAADPAPGADGGHVILYVDPSKDNLLHLHDRSQLSAKNGARGDPAQGSSGAHRKTSRRKAETPPLQVAVPAGTVVKRHRGGQLLGELLYPGQELLVARGGAGGQGVVIPKKPSAKAPRKRPPKRSPLQDEGVEVIEVEDRDFKADAMGMPGQELTLRLIMRLVADIGFVGLPNAGKSSLLSRLTRASPEVAPYPFTTLMPNLGVMSSIGGTDIEWSSPAGPVLADLPGLIDGAHRGRGLGRMFLRHLRRTAALLHVVDAFSENVAGDYSSVREELQLYNPEYCTRPHVVALNKVDLLSSERAQQALVRVRAAAQFLKDRSNGTSSLPMAVVPVSAVTGSGVPELNAALQSLLQQTADSRMQAAATQAANYGLDW